MHSKSLRIASLERQDLCSISTFSLKFTDVSGRSSWWPHWGQTGFLLASLISVLWAEARRRNGPPLYRSKVTVLKLTGGASRGHMLSISCVMKCSSLCCCQICNKIWHTGKGKRWSLKFLALVWLLNFTGWCGLVSKLGSAPVKWESFTSSVPSAAIRNMK